MRVVKYTVAAVSLVLVLVTLAGAEERRPDALSFPPLKFTIAKPQKFTLDNGIKVYYRQDDELPLIAVTVCVGAGSIGVPNNKAGMADLLAAELRSGGAGQWDAAALDDELDAMAARLEVTASTYTTEFSMSLLQEDGARGMRVLAAMVQQPRFDARRFAIKKEQLLEEIRSRRDHSAALAQTIILRQLYAGHPLAKYARQSTVKSITLDDLRQRYDNYFVPANTRIVISGAISRSAARKLLNAQFGRWQRSGKVQQVPPLRREPTGGVYVVDRPIPQTTIMLAQLGIDKNNPDLYALQVMNYILGGGGFGSRLMNEVRSNRGLAYSVYSFFSIGRMLRGPFIAGCATKTASVAQVVAIMRSEMERMRREPVSAAELTQAKQSLINSFVFNFTNSHALATRIMEQEMYGYPADYLDKYRQRIQAVTVADVQRVARRYLDCDKQVLVLVGDRKALQPQLSELGGKVTEVNVDELL